MLTVRNSKLDSDPRKLDWEWIGHPSGGGFQELGLFIIEHRTELKVIGEVSDNSASYSYDDYALVKLKGKYYLLETSGCSCPSPTETWCVVEGPCTLDEMAAKIESAIKNNNFGLVPNQPEEFRGLIKAARSGRKPK